MAWGSPQDYWWLRPTEPDNPLPAMQFGAQLRQQAIATALKEKDLQLETQRNGIMLQEYFSKKELQNKVLAGGSKLATMMAGTTNLADPAVLVNLWKVAEEQPELMATPAWTGALKLHEDAVKAKDRLKELEASRVARTENVERRLSVLSQHYENQDQVAALRVELQEARQIQDEALRERRINQIEMQEERLQRDLRLREDRLQWQMGQMSPEQRLLYTTKTKALQDEAVMGKVRDPKTGKLSTEEYQRRAKAIEDEFFGSGRKSAPVSPAGTPLNTTTKEPITKEEYDKLPVGATYVAPDGSTRVKK